jgi:hypothetical protein
MASTKVGFPPVPALREREAKDGFGSRVRRPGTSSARQKYFKELTQTLQCVRRTYRDAVLLAQIAAKDYFPVERRITARGGPAERASTALAVA